MRRRPFRARRTVKVIGDGDSRGPGAHRILEWAEEVGHELARGGAVVITDGLGGVMRTAFRGALAAGGETIGILLGSDRSEANEYVRTAIATGLGVARNIVVVCRPMRSSLSAGVMAPCLRSGWPAPGTPRRRLSS